MAVAQSRDADTATRTQQLVGMVVSHTHWDREWYLTFERFRMRMVDMLDTVLDILDTRSDFRAFTLDGQTVLLEDYLEMRPGEEARVRRHVREGRLLIGPHYVLADGFLSSGETMVRNLLIGGQVAERFGRVMKAGYLPDNFGHPSQIPQLLAGFDINTAVIYRGVRHDKSEFLWQSPDGTNVFTAFLPEGYCNANVLSTSPQLFAESTRETIERLRAYATTPYVLIMNGCDHMSPRGDLEDAIRSINKEVDDTIRLEQGTFEEFAVFVREKAPHLDVVAREFRAGRPGRITPGVISTRMYLKQTNFRAFTMLERAAEPLSAMASLLGERYPATYLAYAWRKLLQNMPHDSITGCSTDAVHRDMMARFGSVLDIGEELAHRGALAIADRAARGRPEGPAGFLTYNVLPAPRRELVRQRLHFLESGAEFHVVDAGGRTVATQVLGRKPIKIDYSARFETFDADGKPYPVVLAADKAQRAAIRSEKRWQRWVGEEVELLFAADLPGMGYATYEVIPGPSAAPTTDLRSGADWAENARLRVQVHRDGTFDVVDKRTGGSYRGLGALESGGDRGDEYTFAAPQQDRIATTRGARGDVRVAESGPLRVTFEVRVALEVPLELAPERVRRSDKRVALPIVTRISLAAGGERVEVSTTVENSAKDHRLRAVFPAPVRTDVAHAHGQFTVDVRPIELTSEERKRELLKDEEREETTQPHRFFVDVNDGSSGLAVLNRGLTEYEVERTGDGVRICLTLLRCVGFLSRDDFHTRAGGAGPYLATPDAQCQGTHQFDYAVVPHAGGWVEANVHGQAESFVTPVHSAAIATAIDTPVRSFVSIDAPEIVFSAFKLAENSDDFVLRVYNIAPREAEGRVRFGWKPASVRLAKLSEQPLEELAAHNDSVRLTLRPSEICTLLVSRPA